VFHICSEAAPLGAGRDGQVVAVRDDAGKVFAAKRFRPDADGTTTKMAILEMSALLALRCECGEHTNVIHVVTAGEVDGIDGLCMIMPFHKVSLRDAIVSGAKLAERSRLLALGGVLDAIAFLHANHMVHRDVKASNIMLAHDGRAVLCDFRLGEDHGHAKKVH
jgi:serine/threonine protein kinase